MSAEHTEDTAGIAAGAAAPGNGLIVGNGERYGLMANGSSTRRSKFIIMATVAAIIVAAGLMVIVINLFGGDEPAPVTPTVHTSSTPTGTTQTTASQAATVETTGAVATEVQGDSALRSTDWSSVTGAAGSVDSPAAAQNGFVQTVIYSDLNGDGSEDALVMVRDQGSGAYLDYYVYSYASGAPAALFERRGVSHGQVELGKLPQSFVETEAVYLPTDPNCCPSSLKKTTYLWSAGAGAFIVAATETVPSP